MTVYLNTLERSIETKTHSKVIDNLFNVPLFGSIMDLKKHVRKDNIVEVNKRNNKFLGMNTGRLAILGVAVVTCLVLAYTAYSFGTKTGAFTASRLKDAEYLGKYGAVERYMITPEMRAQAEIINYACENHYINSPCSRTAVLSLMGKAIIPDQNIPGSGGKKF